MPTRWGRWALCGAVAAGLAAWGMLRSQQRTTSASAQTDAQERLAAQRQASAAFAPLAMTALSTMGSSEAVLRVLAHASTDHETADSLQDDDVQAVLKEVASLIYFRYGQSDPQAYIDWRRRAGYQFLDRELLLKGHREDTTVRLCTGRLPREDESLAELFTQVCRCYAEKAKPYSRPRGIASEQAGLCLTFGRVTAQGRRHVYPTLSGRLGEAWNAPLQGGPVSWFESTPDVRSLMAQGLTLSAATLGVVLECEDGSRYPMHFLLFKRPDSGRWVIDAVRLAAFEHADTQAVF